jgi:hypothetical protein
MVAALWIELSASCSIFIISRAELSSEDISSSFNCNVTQLQQQVFTLDIISLTKTVDTVETEHSVFTILFSQRVDGGQQCGF